MVARFRASQLDRLEQTATAVMLMSIFEDVFPARFARIAGRRFEIEPASGVCSGLLAFYGALGTLFPLRDFEVFADAIDSGLAGIPFLPSFETAGFDYCPEAYGSSVALALGLLADGDNSYDDCEMGDHAVTAAVSRAAPLPFSPGICDALEKRAQRLRTPLRHLPLALEVASRSSDNPFLRGDCECGGDCFRVPWSAANVRTLAEDFKAARAGLRKLDRLSAWLDRDTEAHAAQAVRFWNSCAADQP